MENEVPGFCRREATRLVFEVPTPLAPRMLRELEGIGIPDVMIQNGRVSRLVRGRLPLLRGTRLPDESPSARILAWVPRNCARNVLSLVGTVCRMDIPGHGNAWTQDVILSCGPAMARCLDGMTPPALPEGMEIPHLHEDLAVLVFIVPRGLGGRVAAAALAQGTSVPGTVYGRGAGMRDRLGLLRITIPAEKEVLRVLVPRHDADAARVRILEDARIAHGGQAFATWQPAEMALPDTRLSLGHQAHAASMEQVIGAIDAMRGNTRWRRRQGPGEGMPETGRMQQTALHLMAGPDAAAALATAAMEAGAPGGTAMEMRYQHSGSGENSWGTPGGRSLTLLVLPSDKADIVARALETAMAGTAGEGSFLELQATRRQD